MQIKGTVSDLLFAILVEESEWQFQIETQIVFSFDLCSHTLDYSASLLLNTREMSH